MPKQFPERRIKIKIKRYFLTEPAYLALAELSQLWDCPMGAIAGAAIVVASAGDAKARELWRTEARKLRGTQVNVYEKE